MTMSCPATLDCGTLFAAADPLKCIRCWNLLSCSTKTPRWLVFKLSTGLPNASVHKSLHLFQHQSGATR